MTCIVKRLGRIARGLLQTWVWLIVFNLVPEVWSFISTDRRSLWTQNVLYFSQEQFPTELKGFCEESMIHSKDFQISEREKHANYNFYFKPLVQHY